MFSNFKLTTSSGKRLEDISHSHIVPLMYKLITSSKDSDDLSTSFGQRRNRRRDELALNKNIKGKYHLRIMPKGVFGSAEHREKVTYGLDYKLTLRRNKDNAVIDKAVGIADARIEIDQIYWYVPHCTLSIQQQGFLFEQILSKTTTTLRYVERSVCLKEVNNQNLWKFELGSQESMNIPIWIIIGFQPRDRQDSQSLNNDAYCRLPVTSCQCIIGTEKYPDNSILLNYDDDNFSQGFAQIKEAFRA